MTTDKKVIHIGNLFEPKNIECLFKQKNLDGIYYTNVKGMYKCQINTFTPFVLDKAKIFFKILEKYHIKYVVAFGSNIGYLRNKKSMPWIDDYDIIVLEEDLGLLKNIFSILIENGFRIIKVDLDNGRKSNYHIICEPINSSCLDNHKFCFFQCDIFTCYFEDDYLSNVAGWGWKPYGNKLKKDIVYPVQYKYLDGIRLPFMNNVQKDVEIYFGSITDAVLYVQHGDYNINIGSWEKGYDDYNLLIKMLTKQTMTFINLVNYQKLYHGMITNDFNLHVKESGKCIKLYENKEEHMHILNLQFLVSNNIKLLYIYKCDSILTLLADIKFFIPKMTILVYHDDNKCNIKKYIDYADVVISGNEDIINYYNMDTMIYNQKPVFILDNDTTDFEKFEEVIKSRDLFFSD